MRRRVEPAVSRVRSSPGGVVVRILFALAALTWPSPGAATEFEDITDPRRLVSELGLQMSLESAYGDADSVIPVPDFDGRATLEDGVSAPVIDGEIDERFWDISSSFLWTTVGDSELRSRVTWRIYVALWRDALWLAGEESVLREEESPPEGASIRLLANSRQSIFIRDPIGRGGPYAKVESPGATGRVTEYGVEFASTGPDGLRWEMRVPDKNQVWKLPVGGAGSLRLVASTGRWNVSSVSPAIRLVPAPISLRVNRFEEREIREIVASFSLVNHTPQSFNVRLDYNDEVTLPSRGRIAVSRQDTAAQSARGMGWSFHVEEIACRVGLPTAYRDPARLNEQVTEHLTRARSNLAWLGAGQTDLRKRIDALQEEGTDSEFGPEDAERLYVQARTLTRETFFARLPADFKRIVFVGRYAFRSGPFYASYLHDMPGGCLLDYQFASQDSVPRVGRALLPGAGESIQDLAIDSKGQRVVFALRNSAGATHLWLKDLDGEAQKHRLTGGAYHDIEPGFLPNGEIVFSSNRHGSQSPINTTDNFCLHVVSPETGAIRRLSHNNLMDFTPTVLDDGRIVFLRWVHEDKPGYFINALWTVYPDGRGLSGFFGMNRPGVTIEPQSIAASNQVVCIDSGPNGHWRAPQAGAIAVLDPRVSQNEFLYRIEREHGGFKNPYPVTKDIFLVSGGWVDTRWGIYLVDQYGNEEIVYRDPEFSCFDPLPVRVREHPNVIPDLRSRDASKAARLLVQDIYEGLPGVPRGAVKSLRVVHSTEKPRLVRHGFHDQTVPLGINNRNVRRDLGTVPVRGDGSVFLEVPPDTNIFFQALDGQGRLVQGMRDSTSFAPGEMRSCVGCHEDSSLTPVGEPMAMVDALREEPSQLDRAGLSPRVSFETDVQPVLDRHCIECHDAEDPADGVALSGDATPYFNLAYETLVKGGESYSTHYSSRVVETGESATLAPALTYAPSLLPPVSSGSAVSPLLKLLDSRHQGVLLTKRDQALLARWIDFNRPFYGDWEGGRFGEERRILSARSEDIITSILRVRCRGCHVPVDLFRGAAINLTRPWLSSILRAPMPRAAGGTGQCGSPVFASPEDVHYRAMREALTADSRKFLDQGR